VAVTPLHSCTLATAFLEPQLKVIAVPPVTTILAKIKVRLALGFPGVVTTAVQFPETPIPEAVQLCKPLSTVTSAVTRSPAVVVDANVGLGTPDVSNAAAVC